MSCSLRLPAIACIDGCQRACDLYSLSASMMYSVLLAADLRHGVDLGVSGTVADDAVAADAHGSLLLSCGGIAGDVLREGRRSKGREP